MLRSVRNARKKKHVSIGFLVILERHGFSAVLSVYRVHGPGASRFRVLTYQPRGFISWRRKKK